MKKNAPEPDEEEAAESGKSKKARNKKAAGKGKDNISAAESSGLSTTFYMHSLFLLGGRILNRVLDGYNGLFEMTPRDKAKIYRNVSTHYIKKGLYDKALEHLKEWVRLEPENPEALYQLAVSLATAEDRQEAIGALEKVLAINPKHKNALFRKRRPPREAQRSTTRGGMPSKGPGTGPRNAQGLHYLLGISYDAMEEIDKAIEAMQKAVALDPNEIKYHQHLGFLNVRRDDHKTAAGHFSKVMELEREQEEDDE